jgi:hypothetical protein
LSLASESFKIAIIMKEVGSGIQDGGVREERCLYQLVTDELPSFLNLREKAWDRVDSALGNMHLLWWPQNR